MANKVARKLTPISELSEAQKSKRRMARKLGFKSEDQLERWITNKRNLPENDPRHLREGIGDEDIKQLNRIRQIERRYKTPAARLLEKKRILVEEQEVPNHMSAFAFLDRYQDQLAQLLRDPATSDYRRRQLRAMKRDLDARINAGDIGKPRQLELFRM